MSTSFNSFVSPKLLFLAAQSKAILNFTKGGVASFYKLFFATIPFLDVSCMEIPLSSGQTTTGYQHVPDKQCVFFFKGMLQRALAMALVDNNLEYIHTYCA